MNDDGIDSSSAPDPLEPILESFMARIRRGERPSIKDYAARFPAHADEIHELLPPLVEMEQAARGRGQPTPSILEAVSSLRAVANRVAGLRGAVQLDEADLKQLGDYKILGEIGRGGMGIVYEAERMTLRNRVALKVIRSKYRGRDDYLLLFLDEARAAASLHHTNIVTVFDYGQHDGIPFYAMQLIAGHSLDKVLADVKRLQREASTSRRAARDRRPDLGETAAFETSRGRASGPDASLRTVSIGLLQGSFDSAISTATAATLPGGEAATHQNGTHASQAATPPPRSTASEEEGQPAGYSGLGTGSQSSRSGTAFLGYQREIARIGLKVADALEYAHKRKLIHRDVKPQNILLDALGNPWITDFGLAKLRRDAAADESFSLAGTLRYMAPERLQGESDGRDDVYALGATLYELLAFRPVFDGFEAHGLILKIENEPPVPLRQVDRRIHPDLAAVVAKALAKDPADRYQTAGGLRDDLRRFIENRPVDSRPRPAHSRFLLWCRRNPWLAAASIAAVAMTTALAVGATITAKILYDRQVQVLAYAEDLERSETRARGELFRSKVSEARASRLSGEIGQRFGSLDAISEAAKIGRELGHPPERFDSLRDSAIASLMLPDLKPVGPPIDLPDVITSCAFDDGMARYAFRKLDGTIVVRQFGNDREIARFASKGDREIWVFAFSPDGKFLASRDGNTISVWDVDRNTLAWTAPGVCKNYVARFSPNSRRIVVSPRDGTILVNDLATGECRSWSDGPKSAVLNLTFLAGGAELAVGYSRSQPTCRILDAETGRQLRAISSPSSGELAWSRDNSTLAIAGSDAKIGLFSGTRAERAVTIELPRADGLGLAFHPSGTLLATNSFDGRLRLWDAGTGRERLSLRSAAGAAFSGDGRMFSWVGKQLRPWQVDPAVEFTTLSYASKLPLNHERVSVHRDGRILAVGTDRGVILWDLARKSELGFLPIGMAWHTAFEPSGDLLTNGQAGVLRWAIRGDPATGELRVGPPRSLPLQGTTCAIDTDRTGRIVAVAGHQTAQVILDGRPISIGPLDDCRGVSLSVDGKWLTTNSHANGGVTIWRLPDGASVARPIPEGPGKSQFSPDGKWLITHDGFSSHLREVGSWSEVRSIEGDFRAFSPDGRLAIFQDVSNVLKLVEVESGRTLARFERPDPQNVTSLAFSADGSRLVGTIGVPHSTFVIDLRLIRRRLAEMGLDWDAPALPEADPAHPDLPPLPPIRVDYGHLGPDAALIKLIVGLKLNDPRTLEPAIPVLETAVAGDPWNPHYKHLLAECCNNVAWFLSLDSPSGSNLDRALTLSLRAVELEPGKQTSLNTRGVVLYRAGRYSDAVAILDKSLEAGKGRFDGFDLFFLAMAHHRLGHRDEARRCLDRAITWVSGASSLSASYVKELAAFRAEAEAEAVLTKELPDDVFEGSGPKANPSPR